MGSLKMTTEAEAIALARKIALSNPKFHWNEISVTVEQGSIDGRDIWLVGTMPVIHDPENAWLDPFSHEPALYIVDIATGKCVGQKAGTAIHMFPPGRYS